MADGGGLENRYGVKPIVGSNPTPSALSSRSVAARAVGEVVDDFPLSGDGVRVTRGGPHCDVGAAPPPGRRTECGAA